MTIYFYRADEAPYGCFSNFSAHGFHLDGQWWPTCEHFYQAQKVAGTPHAQRIRLAETPRRAADLGRDPSLAVRPDWEQAKVEVMRRAVRAKFEAHADIRGILLATGEEELVEDSDTDDFWGRGASGTGRNMLGRVLMETRTALQSGGGDRDARHTSLRPDRRG